jgi:16S rRNA A1518/A1519 N6-dimethyltransferase RsmA/KsgA/DIM1 with predicted DNA glycosylase/AP lyase activity
MSNFESAALNEARNYRSALVREFARHLGGNTLEIGAGIGQITKALRGLPNIRKLVSVEPDGEFCRIFRDALPGQTLIEGTVSDVPMNERWECVVSIKVLEHIREDEAELAI